MPIRNEAALAGVARHRRKFLAACGLLACLSAPWGSSSADEALPIPTRTRAVTFEIEGDGSREAEVRVAVRVDAEGRPTAAEVVGRETPSDVETALASFATKAVLSWRFLPALQQSRPVSVEVELVLEFTIAGDLAIGPSDWEYATGATLERDAVLRRILLLPDELRLSLRDARVEDAQVYFGGRKLRRMTSEHFVVLTDVVEEEQIRRTSDNLEATFVVLQGMLPPRRRASDSERIPVLVFHDLVSLQALAGGVGRESTLGFYDPFGLLAFHNFTLTNVSLLHVILHEATHAYVARYVRRPESPWPPWLEEGLGEYVGNSKLQGGELVLGKVLQREYYEGYGVRSMAKLKIADVRKAVRKNTAPGLEEILAADWSTFYGEDSFEYYTLSWLLVHYLRHGQKRWAADLFPKLIEAFDDGVVDLERLEALYGPGLEARFAAYLERF